MRAEGLAHARAEPVALDDQGGQRFQGLDAVPPTERPQGLLAAPSFPELESQHGELVPDGIVHRRPLLADPGDRRVEPEPGLEADDHQVEAIRERVGDPAGAAARAPPEPEIRAEVPGGPREGGQEDGPAERLGGGDLGGEDGQRRAEAHERPGAEKVQRRVRAADAGDGERVPEGVVAPEAVLSDERQQPLHGTRA